MLSSATSEQFKHFSLDFNPAVYQDTRFSDDLRAMLSDVRRLLEENIAREILAKVPSLCYFLFRGLSARILWHRVGDNADTILRDELSETQYKALRMTGEMQCSWEVDESCSWPRERLINIIP